MTHVEKEAALREALKAAREAARAWRKGELQALHPGLALEAFIKAVEEALSATWEEAQASAEDAGRALLGSRRETAAEKTIPLPFSRPSTFVHIDRTRKQKVTVTTEDLLEGD